MDSTTTITISDDEDFLSLYQSVYGIIYISLSVIELFMITFFVAQFFNKKSIYRSPYFAIFTTGITVNFLINIPSWNVIDFESGICKNVGFAITKMTLF